MKSYRLISLIEPLGGKGISWIMSSRKLSDEEAQEVWKRSEFRFDLDDLGFDYFMTGRQIGSMLSLSCSKKKAEDILKQLNDGTSPFSFMNLEDLEEDDDE